MLWNRLCDCGEKKSTNKPKLSVIFFIGRWKQKGWTLQISYIIIMALLLISFSKRLELIDNRLSMSVLGRRDARGTVLLKYHTLKCYCQTKEEKKIHLNWSCHENELR